MATSGQTRAAGAVARDTNGDDAPAHEAASPEQGVGELVRRLSEQTSRLVRDELRLAELETRQRAKATGVGAGVLGFAGVLALLGGGALTAAAVWAVHLVLTGWLSCVVVAAGLFLVAGMAALVGRGALAKAAPPVPKVAMASTKADVEAVREALR